MGLEHLSEDDSNEFAICCGSLHSFIASAAFCLFDFLAVVTTLAIYAHYTLDGPSWANVVPLAALCLSIVAWLFGPVGLAREDTLQLRVYRCRLLAVALFAVVWSAVCFYVQDDVSGVLVGITWALATVLYGLGVCFVGRAIDFLNAYKWALGFPFLSALLCRFRGFDGADPVVMQRVLGAPTVPQAKV